MDKREETFLNIALDYKKQYKECAWWKFKKRNELYKSWQSALHLLIKQVDRSLPVQQHLHYPGGVSIRLFIFKVQDYTTELVGRYNEEKDCYYVQRGDGSKYEYESYRIEWKRELNVC